MAGIEREPHMEISNQYWHAMVHDWKYRQHVKLLPAKDPSVSQSRKEVYEQDPKLISSCIRQPHSAAAYMKWWFGEQIHQSEDNRQTRYS